MDLGIPQLLAILENAFIILHFSKVVKRFFVVFMFADHLKIALVLITTDFTQLYVNVKNILFIKSNMSGASSNIFLKNKLIQTNIMVDKINPLTLK